MTFDNKGITYKKRNAGKSGRGEKKMMYSIVEVSNVTGTKSYTVDSLEQAALASGDWSYETYQNMPEAKAALDDVPEELVQALEKGPAVWVHCSMYEHVVPASKFDADSEALAYLAYDKAAFEVVSNLTECQHAIDTYKGPARVEVISALEVFRDEYKKEQVVRDPNGKGNWFAYDRVQGCKNMKDKEALVELLRGEGVELSDNPTIAVYLSDDGNDIAYAVDTDTDVVFTDGYNLFVPDTGVDMWEALSVFFD